MSAKSHIRGNPIEWDEEIKSWVYLDNKAPAGPVENERPCFKCGMKGTTEGHDACLGELPGVRNACCGHGDLRRAYIDRVGQPIVRGIEASLLLIELGASTMSAATQNYVDELIRERDAALEREAVMAAHVEHLDRLRRNVIAAIADDRLEDLDISFYRDDMQPKMHPTTSLARRDLIKQAEALENEANGWPKDKYTECSHVRESILNSATELRQRAQALD